MSKKDRFLKAEVSDPEAAVSQFTVKRIARANAWVILDPRGIEVYDGAPDGNDKEIIYHDPDEAQEACDRMNEGMSDD